MKNLEWKKIGLVYTPPKDRSWRDNTALTPTAVEIKSGEVRVYAGFRDLDGISRVGYVDLDADNPSKIIKISEHPVLDIGDPGMFDDNGVILGDIVPVGNLLYMYYVGFQLVANVKFQAYSGLAISKDNGETFERYKKTPILDRSEEGLFIRAIHSVIYEQKTFKVWYAVGSSWETINNKKFPRYDINYLESENGVDFSAVGLKVIENDRSNQEYRIGRPRVYKKNDFYVMNFTYGTTDNRYQSGQATSINGIDWNRSDKDFKIRKSNEGWDSLHLSYPNIITLSNGKTLMFYNGNNMGEHGFGCAVAVGESY